MTQELNMNELFALEAEISGFASQGQVIFKGLLQQDISYAQKFRLEDIVYKIAPYKERLRKMRTELLQKYGEQGEDGNTIIPEFLDEAESKGDQEARSTPNPSWQKANEELAELMETPVSLEVYPFSESDFDFNATEYYPVFNKLIRSIKEQQVSAAN